MPTSSPPAPFGTPPSPRAKRHPYDQWSPDARALDLVGDKWTLLIIRDLVGGPRRFVEIQRTLPGISTEQLRTRLARMVADGLLTRVRYREVPPRVDYELTARARALEPVIAALTTWGRAWAWSAPGPGEVVDVGAVLRAATGLPLPAGTSGRVEVVVTDAGGGPRTYVLEAAGDGLRYAELETGGAAKVSGPTQAWVAALGPDGSRDGLRIDGDAALADALLSAIAPPG